MTMTVIASNSQEAALLDAFRRMTDVDRRATVAFAKASALDNPRKKQASTPRLHLVPALQGGR